MGNRGGTNNGRGGGGDRGGSRGRGRGRGRGGGGGGRGGGGGGFVPFGGLGQVLGDPPLGSPSDNAAPRGGRGGASRPFGRGRGGRLAVQGQNQVAFDYSAFSRSSRRRDDTAEILGDGGDGRNQDQVHRDDQGADFSMDPPKGYQHRHKPHLEIPSVPAPGFLPANRSHVHGSERLHDPTIAAIIPTRPQGGPPVFPSRRFQSSKYKPQTPQIFPEYHTSRGSGFGNRPPEENEDAKYLAGVPGLRRLGQDKRRPNFRSGDPARNDDNPLRKPLSFVKATGEWKDGKFIPFDGDNAAAVPVLTDETQHKPQSLEQQAMQVQTEAFTAGSERPKHAGLGFSRTLHTGSTSAAAQAPQPDPLAGSLELDNPDALADFLQAFPGSRELRSDEGIVDDLEPKVSILIPPPSSELSSQTPFAPPEAKTLETEAPVTLDHGRDEVRDPTSLSTSPSGDDNGQDHVLAPCKTRASSPEPLDESGTQQYAESDSDEERQLDEILRNQGSSNGAVLAAEAPSQGEGDPFVIDLTGESPRLDPSEVGYSRSAHRVALGDAIVQSESDEEPEINLTQRQPRGVGKKARNAAKKARRRDRAKQERTGSGADLAVHERVPREGDSDLDWGSDGPPGGDGQRDHIEQDVLALAAAGITFKDVHPTDVEMPRTAVDKDAMLKQALEASLGLTGATATPSMASASKSVPLADIPVTKKRNANQARKLAAARSRKAHEAAMLADYLDNIRAQEAQQDEDESADGRSSEGDIQEERLGDLLQSGANSKAKGKAGSLEAKLDERTELDTLIRFMDGMDPQKGGRHKSLGDVADEADMKEEEEWMTEESDEDGDEIDRDGHVDDARAAVTIKEERRLRSGSGKGTSRRGVFDESERRMLNGAKGAEDSDEERLAEKLRKILDSEDSDLSLDSQDDADEDDEEDSDEDDEEDDDSDDSDDDSDDDDGMFRGKFSWAEQDEAFIAKLTQNVGSGRKAQRRVFKAIQKGEFGGLLEGDDDFGIDPSDPVYGLGSVAPAKRGKDKGKNWTGDDLWAEELQQQWQKDRASKAANKQKRAAERQAAALSPFPATHKKGKKKAEKKARRAAKREAKATGRATGWSDEGDSSLLAFGGLNGSAEAEAHELGRRFATSLAELDEQIQIFLKDVGKTTLTLPAMDKRSRAQVHMLAEAYTLKSKSKGKGANRFPTLIKTSRSGLVVDHRRVRRILLGHSGGTFGVEGGGRNPYKVGGGSGNKRTVGATGGGGMAPKNREGEEVGWGAEKIGADNIGHKLLAAMGWTEGTGIGVSKGISDPVSATVKVSKGGLGW